MVAIGSRLLLAGMLAVAGVLALAAPGAAEVSATVDGLTYTADPADPAAGATVVGYVDSDSAVRIPSTVLIGSQQYAVTSIATGAFPGRELTSVVLPDTLTTIGEAAFRDNRLTSVQVGASVRRIGPYAFAGNALTSLTLPTA